MNDLLSLIRELYSDLDELGDEEFIDKSRVLLDGYSRSAVLVANFLEFQDSRAHALLIYLGFWFESIGYEDIWEAMRELGGRQLAAYHFSVFIPEVFAVDVRKAALEFQEAFPGDRDKVTFFVDLKHVARPSKGDMDLLREYGASPERIRAGLLASGTPLLPLPVDG